jgi:hypothetical protein
MAGMQSAGTGLMNGKVTESKITGIKLNQEAHLCLNHSNLSVVRNAIFRPVATAETLQTSGM